MEVLYSAVYGKPLCAICGAYIRWRGSFNQQNNCAGYCSSKCAGASDSVKSKRSDTCMERYGVSAVQKVEKIRKRFKRSMIERHGVEYTASSSRLRKKMETTMLERFGVKHAFNSEEAKAKGKATLMKKFGVEFIMQNREVFERQQHSGFRIREFELEGKIFRVRGYEEHAIRYLYRQGCRPKDIRTTHAEGVPSVRYSHDGKQHVYHPDIKANIKGKWWVIEVKSTHTLGLKHPETFARVKRKAKACVEAGFNFRLLLVSRTKRHRVVSVKKVHEKTRKEVLRELRSLPPDVCA